MYSYTRPVRAMHNSYKSALALRVLFYFLRSLYIYGSPYSIRDTHYRLIEYITFGVLLYVTHSDHLAIPTISALKLAEGLTSTTKHTRLLAYAIIILLCKKLLVRNFRASK